MSRIWNVRLNLDEWNSGLAGLDDDGDRLRFLIGFNAGLNGKPNMDKGIAWESGWRVGNSSHLEAVRFGEQQRAKALKRDYGNATAMPRHDQGNATAMPIDNPQSTIEVSNNRSIEQSKEELPIAPQPEAKKPRQTFGPEILTSTGTWKLPLTTAKRHAKAYGYSDSSMLVQVERLAAYYGKLPSEKLPGMGGMHQVVESWLAKHAPACAAKETGPIAAPVDQEQWDYLMKMQLEFDVEQQSKKAAV